MENKARYTLVGFFVLSFSIAMVLFILWLARYDSQKSSALQYRIYSTTSIAGLNEKSIVEYKGLDIGLVEKIQINPNNHEQIEIILSITHPQIIKTDSYALIQSQGITGNKTIEIDGGGKDSQNLLPNKEGFAIIPIQPSFLEKITNDAGDITTQINLALQKINYLLNEENLQSIENILHNTDKSTKNFDVMVSKVNTLLDTSLQSTLKNIDSLSKNLDTIVAKDVHNAVNNFDQLTQNLNDLSKNINTLIKQDIKPMINEFHTTAHSTQGVDKVLTDLQRTLQKVDNTLDNFNQNGGNIIFQTRDIKYGPGE